MAMAMLNNQMVYISLLYIEIIWVVLLMLLPNNIPILTGWFCGDGRESHFMDYDTSHLRSSVSHPPKHHQLPIISQLHFMVI